MKTEIDKELYLKFYKNLKLTRRFEEKTIELMNKGEIPGALHPSNGMEAVGVGVCSALIKGDMVCPSHRTISAQITKGAEIKYLMAEYMGKVDGYNRGKGGSMHINAGFENDVFGVDSVVGGKASLATGIALAAKLRKNNSVTAVFFGDGAMNQGVVLESMNMAAIWKLPVLFVCENNQYAATTSAKDSTLLKNLSSRADAFGFSGYTVDGMDVLAVYSKAIELVRKMREGNGPSLLEAKTYRFRGHWSGEELQNYVKYRTKDEIKEWELKCPILTFGKYLTGSNICSKSDIEAIDEEIEKILEDAVDFARASSYPPAEEGLKGMYATEYQHS